ncbi:hypothetical protein ASZ90_015028 [hydrocarbon metagenome]|uniref:Uncharacterized protein n=1 Tax=hydrocarbon metagenome TaxID=938273 RepID=A0A0W8F390_9ZZZZ
MGPALRNTCPGRGDAFHQATMTLRGIREGQSLHHRRRTTGNNSLVEKPRSQETPEHEYYS